MELNLQIMTYGNAWGNAAHDFWKPGRGHTNKSRSKIFCYELFLKKKGFGRKQNSFRKECLLYWLLYLRMHCLSTRQSSYYPNEDFWNHHMYETSFFSSIFLLRFFSNVNFARWNSPLTFYEILWITQTFFLKKVNKQMCFVLTLTTRLKSCPSKPWSWVIYKKMHLLMPKKQISIEFACWFFSALEVQKKIAVWTMNTARHCGPVSS